MNLNLYTQCNESKVKSTIGNAVWLLIKTNLHTVVGRQSKLIFYQRSKALEIKQSNQCASSFSYFLFFFISPEHKM